MAPPLSYEEGAVLCSDGVVPRAVAGRCEQGTEYNH